MLCPFFLSFLGGGIVAVFFAPIRKGFDEKILAHCALSLFPPLGVWHFRQLPPKKGFSDLVTWLFLRGKKILLDLDTCYFGRTHKIPLPKKKKEFRHQNIRHWHSTKDKRKGKTLDQNSTPRKKRWIECQFVRTTDFVLVKKKLQWTRNTFNNGCIKILSIRVFFAHIYMSKKRAKPIKSEMCQF